MSSKSGIKNVVENHPLMICGKIIKEVHLKENHYESLSNHSTFCVPA